MHRKEFIRVCSAICLGGSAMAVLPQGCASANYYAATELSGNQLIIRKSAFSLEEQHKPAYRKHVLVNISAFNYPIIVYRFDGETYSALLLECTHKSCELLPQGDYLVCPCHGSEFSNRGIVQNPPAEQNLRTFQVKQDAENVYIQLRVS